MEEKCISDAQNAAGRSGSWFSINRKRTTDRGRTRRHKIRPLAVEYKVGARSLRGIFEEMIAPVMYVVPDRSDIKRVEIKSLFEEAILHIA